VNLFDSHVHFDAFQEEGSVESLIQQADSAHVSKMISVGGSQDANSLALELSRKHEGKIFAAVGYDRDQAQITPDMGLLESQLAEHPVAIGEIGLDYHYCPETASEQKVLFAAQLKMAREQRLPVIIHNRESDEDMLELLTEHASEWKGSPGSMGVLHCFTGSRDLALRLIDIGLMIGFSGILTFKNANSIREAAEAVPADRLLAETDTPYLAPVPHRGRRNEPAYVALVVEKLAEVRNCSVDEVADITSRNASRLFGCER